MSDRAPDALRTLTLEPGWAPQAEGSCLIGMGDTRVLCTASVEESLPPWREASGKGWVTAEYGMLPRSTHSRRSRERKGAGGRTREIERLIGRSLRSVVDFEALGPRTVIVDCDVLQADGGTRTASITGGFLALAMACFRLRSEGVLDNFPLVEAVAAISVGIVDGEPRLDLDYALDSAAQVDMNVVATESGKLVEVQGTAEGEPFTRDEHDRLLDLAFHGIEQCLAVQRQLMDFLEARV